MGWDIRDGLAEYEFMGHDVRVASSALFPFCFSDREAQANTK
jgi:hypothetical protein